MSSNPSRYHQEYTEQSKELARSLASDFIDKLHGEDLTGDKEDLSCQDLDSVFFQAEATAKLRKLLKSYSIADVVGEQLIQAEQLAHGNGEFAPPSSFSYGEVLTDSDFKHLHGMFQSSFPKAVSSSKSALLKSNSMDASNGASSSNKSDSHGVFLNWFESKSDKMVWNSLAADVFVPKQKLNKKDRRNIDILKARRMKGREKRIKAKKSSSSSNRKKIGSPAAVKASSQANQAQVVVKRRRKRSAPQKEGDPARPTSGPGSRGGKGSRSRRAAAAAAMAEAISGSSKSPIPRSRRTGGGRKSTGDGNTGSAGGTGTGTIVKSKAVIISTIYDCFGEVLNSSVPLPSFLSKMINKSQPKAELNLEKCKMDSSDSNSSSSSNSSQNSNVSLSGALKKITEDMCNGGIISNAALLNWDQVWSSSCGLNSSSFSDDATITDAFSIDKIFLSDAAPANGSKNMSKNLLKDLREMISDDSVYNICNDINADLSTKSSLACLDSMSKRCELIDESLKQLRSSSFDMFRLSWAPSLAAHLAQDSNAMDSSSKNLDDQLCKLPASINRIANPFDSDFLVDWTHSSKAACQLIAAFVNSTSGINLDHVVSEDDTLHPFVHPTSLYFGKVPLKDALPESVLFDVVGKTFGDIVAQNDASGGASGCGVDDAAMKMETASPNSTTLLPSKGNNYLSLSSSSNNPSIDSFRKACGILDKGLNLIIVDKSHHETRQQQAASKCKLVCDTIKASSSQLSNLKSESQSARAKVMTDNFGPIIMVVKKEDVLTWEEMAKSCLPEFQVVPYYGAENDRAVIRNYLTPDTLYIRQGSCHLIVTHYEAFVVELHFWKTIHWTQIVFDEAWGLLSKLETRYDKTHAAIAALQCRNRIFVSKSLAYSYKDRLCYPDMFSVFGLILPDVAGIFRSSESLSKLKENYSQERCLFNYMRKLLASFTVVFGHNVSDYVFGSANNASKYAPSFGSLRKRLSLPDSVTLGSFVCEMVSWMQWGGVDAEYKDSGKSLVGKVTEICFTDNYVDAELEEEMSVVHFHFVGLTGEHIKRTTYSAGIADLKGSTGPTRRRATSPRPSAAATTAVSAAAVTVAVDVSASDSIAIDASEEPASKTIKRGKGKGKATTTETTTLMAVDAGSSTAAADDDDDDDDEIMKVESSESLADLAQDQEHTDRFSAIPGYDKVDESGSPNIKNEGDVSEDDELANLISDSEADDGSGEGSADEDDDEDEEEGDDDGEDDAADDEEQPNSGTADVTAMNVDSADIPRDESADDDDGDDGEGEAANNSDAKITSTNNLGDEEDDSDDDQDSDIEIAQAASDSEEEEASPESAKPSNKKANNASKAGSAAKDVANDTENIIDATAENSNSSEMKIDGENAVDNSNGAVVEEEDEEEEEEEEKSPEELAIANEKRLAEMNKSVLQRNNHWNAFIQSGNSKQRFLGFFESRQAAEKCFNFAYQQREDESKALLENKNKKSQPKSGESKGRMKKSEESALEHAEKLWENRIGVARRKAKMKSATRSDLEDLMFVLDDRRLVKEISQLLGPQLAAGQSLSDWFSCQGDSLSAFAWLVGADEKKFSAQISSERCILGRALSSCGAAIDELGGEKGLGACGLQLSVSSSDTSDQVSQTIHLGNDLSVAHNHASIQWNRTKMSFELEALSAEGVFVDGLLRLPKAGPIVITNRTIIQVGPYIFFFIVPLTKLNNVEVVRNPLQQRSYLIRALLAHIEYRDGLSFSADRLASTPLCLLDGHLSANDDKGVTLETFSYDHVSRLQDLALFGAAKQLSSPKRKRPDGDAKLKSPAKRKGAKMGTSSLVATSGAAAEPQLGERMTFDDSTEQNNSSAEVDLDLGNAAKKLKSEWNSSDVTAQEEEDRIESVEPANTGGNNFESRSGNDLDDYKGADSDDSDSSDSDSSDCGSSESDSSKSENGVDDDDNDGGK